MRNEEKLIKADLLCLRMCNTMMRLYLTVIIKEISKKINLQILEIKIYITLHLIW